MRKRLRVVVIAFTISFVSLVGLSFFSMWRFDMLINYSDEVDHNNMIIERLYKVEGYIKDLDRAERGFMLTNDTMYLQQLHNSKDSLRSYIASLKVLTSDNDVQNNNTIQLRAALAIRLADIKNNIAYIDSAHLSSPSRYYYEGRKSMTECVIMLRKMHDEESILLSKHFENKRIYQQLTSNTLKYLLFIFFVITVLLFFIMIQALRRRKEFQDELQAKVIDLERSNTELEQIAYAASHDLQEPLRKIRVFSNRLTFLKKDNVDKDTQETMERINAAANRMQELIEDLVILTSLTKQDCRNEAISINDTVKQTVQELDDKITEKEATVHVGAMPDIKGNAEQLGILFKALLENALKFTRPGVKPVVTIESEIVNGDELMDINEKLSRKKFTKISVSDNGIGFDNKFSGKMFRIFQRLHNQYSEFDGKGIGLAVCQRIMANHEGYITADGKPGMGATFSLFFPIVEE